jgi:undecaprenyl-diphosphatase
MNKKEHRIILSLVSLAVFALILIIVLLRKISFDYSVSNLVQKIWSPAVNGFFIFLGNYSEAIMIGIAIIAVSLFYLQKRKMQSLILVFSLGLGYILKNLIKAVVQRDRPLMQLVQETDYSFPSGHALLSIILFSLIIYFYKDDIKNKTGRIIFIAAGIFLILLIGLSRIYLNVHWFTDVIGGYALGFFVVNLGLLFLKKKK